MKILVQTWVDLEPHLPELVQNLWVRFRSRELSMKVQFKFRVSQKVDLTWPKPWQLYPCRAAQNQEKAKNVLSDANLMTGCTYFLRELPYIVKHQIDPWPKPFLTQSWSNLKISHVDLFRMVKGTFLQEQLNITIGYIWSISIIPAHVIFDK